MAGQEEGWPLGLQLLNVRAGLAGRATDYFGSVSFTTLLTTPSSSSSDFDSESTCSFLHDRRMSLGSLLGAPSILDLSRRSVRGGRRSAADEVLKPKKHLKSRAWFFSLCSKDSTAVKNIENSPSLGQFLAVERRITSSEMSLAQHLASVSNSLFLNGEIAHPRLHSGSTPAEEV